MLSLKLSVLAAAAEEYEGTPVRGTLFQDFYIRDRAGPHGLLLFSIYHNRQESKPAQQVEFARGIKLPHLRIFIQPLQFELIDYLGNKSYFRLEQDMECARGKNHFQRHSEATARSKALINYVKEAVEQGGPKASIVMRNLEWQGSRQQDQLREEWLLLQQLMTANRI